MTEAKATKPSRIYIVGHGQSVRLVRAQHRAQALSHVARSVINVKVASQEELVEAMMRSIKVENVREDESVPFEFDGDDSVEA